MKYYYINTDSKSLHNSPHDSWIEHNLAFTGGQIHYGMLLGKLRPGDVCFMFVNSKGVMAVGRVLEEWDKKVYDQPLVYIEPKYDEYRIKVDWFIDLRDYPIRPNELRSIVGWMSSQALQSIDSLNGEKLLRYAESSKISSPDEITEVDTFVEGAKRQTLINAYERNPEARRKCIAYYGTSCIVCGLNLGEQYGEVGDGVIHVHHLRELREIGDTYEVDPIHDLRPVCPNCHAIIHNRKPPYSIEEIKEFLCRKEQN